MYIVLSSVRAAGRWSGGPVRKLLLGVYSLHVDTVNVRLAHLSFSPALPLPASLCQAGCWSVGESALPAHMTHWLLVTRPASLPPPPPPPHSCGSGSSCS